MACIHSALSGNDGQLVLTCMDPAFCREGFKRTVTHAYIQAPHAQTEQPHAYAEVYG